MYICSMVITKEKRREDKRKEEMNLLFETFREMYPGKKRGHDTEFKDFQKHKDWKDVVYLLPEVIEKQIAYNAKLKATGAFVPEWKHLDRWLKHRCWEEVIPEAKVETPAVRDDSW